MIPTVTSPARIYAFSRAMKTRYKAVGWIFMVLGLVAACFLAGMVLANSSSHDAGFMLAVVLGISAVPIAEGIIFLRGASRVSIAVTSETIKANGLLHSRTMRIADVAGKRSSPSRGGVITYLVPRPNCGDRRLRLPDDLSFDEAFDRWFASLPDLNEIKEEMAPAAGKIHSWQEQ